MGNWQFQNQSRNVSHKFWLEIDKCESQTRIRYQRYWLYLAGALKGLDAINNTIILGDMNEDLFNPNMHNLKDVLLINSLHNIIPEPTRQLASIDPIILYENMPPLNQGIINVHLK